MTGQPRAAAVLGLACAARTFAGPAALALRGWPESPRGGRAILAMAAFEAIADKLPLAGPRSRPAPHLARVLAGAVSGARVDGARGASIGAATALAATRPSERVRALIVARTGLPDPAWALVEDSLAYGAALGASQKARPSGRLAP